MIVQTINANLEFWNQQFLGVKVADYLWFAGIIIATLLLKKTFAGLLAGSGNIVARFFNPDKDDKNRLGQLIRKPLGSLLQVILYFFAVNQLDGLWTRVAWHPITNRKGGELVHLDRVLDHIFLFFFIIFLGQFLSRMIDFVYHIQLINAKKEDNKERVQLLPLIKEIGKLLMWSILAFWILGSVFHVNIPALITGLGIGGVAIALAAKESVENFFAAFTILSDKPFEIGDTIRISSIEGTVERIGFRSTRLRSDDGAAHIIPNQKMVGENLVNLSMRNTRVVKLGVNIKYGVPYTDIIKIKAALKKMLAEVAYVKEPIDVLMENFGKDTFLFNVSYALPHPMPQGITVDKVKQEVNTRIYEIVSGYGAFYIATPIDQADKKENEGSE